MVLHRGAAAKTAAVQLVSQLRQARIPALLAFGSRSLKSQFKSANRAEVRYAVILGDDELAQGVATLRDMESGEQTEVGAGRGCRALGGCPSDLATSELRHLGRPQAGPALPEVPSHAPARLPPSP